MQPEFQRQVQASQIAPSIPQRVAIADGVSVRLVVLLALAAFINYVDRGNLATAGPLIRDELALSNAQLGGFSAGFVIAAVVALVGVVAYGVIVRRIETIDWGASGRFGEDTPAK